MSCWKIRRMIDQGYRGLWLNEAELRKMVPVNGFAAVSEDEHGVESRTV